MIDELLAFVEGELPADPDVTGAAGRLLEFLFEASEEVTAYVADIFVNNYLLGLE